MLLNIFHFAAALLCEKVYFAASGKKNTKALVHNNGQHQVTVTGCGYKLSYSLESEFFFKKIIGVQWTCSYM